MRAATQRAVCGEQKQPRQRGRQKGRLRPGLCGFLLKQPSEGPPLSAPKGPLSLSLLLVPYPWPTCTQPSAPLIFSSFGNVSLGHFLTLTLSCCAPYTLWVHCMDTAELRCHNQVSLTPQDKLPPAILSPCPCA